MNRISRTFACGALIALAAVFAACGGKQSIASKSAAAYVEAQKQGIPVSAGEHGGHAADHAGVERMDHATMTGMDHSRMTGTQHGSMAGMDHMKMRAGHTGMAGMDHGAMQSAEHAGMSSVDHAEMPGMQHGATSGAGGHAMTGMEHGAMPGMQHGTTSMAGTQHGAMSGMAGMRHGTNAQVNVVTDAPRTNNAIANVQPGATLRSDDFDAPAPAAVAEATKATSGETMSTKKDHE